MRMKLPVRVRRTEMNEAANTETTVLCPTRGSVPLSECAHCDRNETVSTNARGQSFVHCHPTDEAAEAPNATELGRARVYATDYALPLLLSNTPISSLMTTRVTCVSPDLEVKKLAEIFLSEGFNGAPVVNKEGFPLGMVSKTDLIREHYEAELFHDEVPKTVGELMTQNTMRLPESASLGEAAALMGTEGLHRVPVVSADGKVVGILTATDIVRWLAASAGYALSVQKT